MASEVKTARKRDAVRSRRAIIDVASRLFATQGYRETGLREIGAEAGVVPSLIIRHFGSKANLLREAMVSELRQRSLGSYSKKGFGHLIARHLAHEADGMLIATIILAISAPDAREVAQNLYREAVLDTMAEWLGGPDALGRATRILLLMNGFVVMNRYILSEPGSSDLVDWLGDAIQAIVDTGASPETAMPMLNDFSYPMANQLA